MAVLLHFSLLFARVMALEGHIIEVGEMCYKIPEDGLGLNYQWDTLFGITVICPQDIDLEATIDFLLSIN